MATGLCSKQSELNGLGGSFPSLSAMHNHRWIKSGEFRPTTIPIYVYFCDRCGAITQGQDGPELVRYGIDYDPGDDDFYRPSRGPYAEWKKRR